MLLCKYHPSENKLPAAVRAGKPRLHRAAKSHRRVRSEKHLRIRLIGQLMLNFITGQFDRDLPFLPINCL